MVVYRIGVWHPQCGHAHGGEFRHRRCARARDDHIGLRKRTGGVLNKGGQLRLHTVGRIGLAQGFNMTRAALVGHQRTLSLGQQGQGLRHHPVEGLRA